MISKIAIQTLRSSLGRIINLGGVHSAQPGTVDLDLEAAKLGISKCNTYSLDLFFAERHTTESNFRVDTSMRLLSL